MSEKESWKRTRGTSKWGRLGQVAIRGISGTGTREPPYWIAQDEIGTGDLQIRSDRMGQWTGLCPAEPVHLSKSGTTRPWTISFP